MKIKNVLEAIGVAQNQARHVWPWVPDCEVYLYLETSRGWFFVFFPNRRGFRRYLMFVDTKGQVLVNDDVDIFEYDEDCDMGVYERARRFYHRLMFYGFPRGDFKVLDKFQPYLGEIIKIKK
jgi:hypothetical protein